MRQPRSREQQRRDDETDDLFARDGLYLIGFGPRAADAARELMAALYPEARIPPFRAELKGTRE